MSTLVVVLTAACLLAARGPRGRPGRSLAPPRAPLGGAGAPGGPGPLGRPGDEVAGPRSGQARRSGQRDRGAGQGLAELLLEVTAGLRAGRSPALAWQDATGVPVGPDGTPGVHVLVAVAQGPSRQWFGHGFGRWTGGLPGGGSRTREPDEVLRRAASVVAAARLAARLGTPLAPVLDRVADTLAVDAELEAERQAALAGPRATARLLGWLPALGLLLGMVLGADPWGVIVGGGLAGASAIGGVVFLAAGHCWTRRLLRRAVLAGAPDGPGRAVGAAGAPARPGPSIPPVRSR